MSKTEFIGGVAAAALIAAGIAVAANVYRGYQKGLDTYRDLMDRYTSTGADATDDENAEGIEGTIIEAAENILPEDAPERIAVDWDDLLDLYPDCVAWIQIPTVEISYPVMQSNDNDYYLHRSPEGNYLYAGSIFMEYQNTSDFSDRNTVIYGHNMRNGSMFGKLKQLNDSDALVSCPYFWIYTPAGDYLYRIFSVHVVDTYGDTYTIQFADGKSYADWVQEMNESSDVETGAQAENDSFVVTLSTCNGNKATRQVVQGYQIWSENRAE